MEHDPGPSQESEKPQSDPMLEGIRKLLATMVDRADTWIFRSFGSRLLGLGRRGDDDVLDEIMRSEVDTHASGVTSDDPDTQAEAFRFFFSLHGANKASGDETVDPDTHFMRQPLSGEEAKTCLVDLLGGLPWGVTNPIREVYDLPREHYEVNPDSFGANLTPLQEITMAVAIAGNLGYVNSAVQNRKLVLPEKFMATDDEKDEIAVALGTNAAFVDTTFDERKQLVEWAFGQLPRLLRGSFERQQAIREQFGNDTDHL